MTDTVFRSLKEVQRTYLPNSILNRLEEELCDRLEMTQPHQHRLSKRPDNPKIGLVEVAKSSRLWSFDISQFVKQFYEGEGYSVDDRRHEQNILYVKKDDERFRISIFEPKDAYSLWISEPFFEHLAQEEVLYFNY